MKTNKQLVNLIGTSGVKSVIASGQSIVSEAISLDRIKALVVGMAAAFGNTPDANVRLEIQTSPDNQNWDTVAYALFEIDFSADSTLQKSSPINSDAHYIRFKASNLDGADDISVWVYGTKTLAYIVVGKSF